MKKLLKIVGILLIAILFIGFGPHKLLAQTVTTCPVGYTCTTNLLITTDPASLSGDTTDSYVISGSGSRKFTLINTSENNILNVKKQANLSYSVTGTVAGDTSTDFVVLPGLQRIFTITNSNNESILLSKKDLSIVSNNSPVPVQCPQGYVCVGNPYITNQKVSVVDIDNGTQAVIKKVLGFSFKINNLSESDIYVSKDPNKLVSVVTGLSYKFNSLDVTSPRAFL